MDDEQQTELDCLKNIIANVEAGNADILGMDANPIDDGMADIDFLISINQGRAFNPDL